MKDMMGLMKQAQAMQARMKDVQAELENTLVTGQAGGGAVTITLTAKGAMTSIALDPSVLRAEDKDMLEDLILTAHQQARAAAERVMEDKMKAVTAGMPLPAGMKLPF
jgi:DNA-binding YbaB/EbfC family protein